MYVFPRIRHRRRSAVKRTRSLSACYYSSYDGDSVLKFPEYAKLNNQDVASIATMFVYLVSLLGVFIYRSV
ncbi:hypothetical protein AAVH_01017 [Aphelenchoides avenae]|nr:hypothetical protein AAVH_01017 [Aphelenchus avenae]